MLRLSCAIAGVVGFCLCPAAASAVETMRIAMGADGAEARLEARRLSFGTGDEAAAYHPLPGGHARVRLERGRLFLNESQVGGDSVRFRAGELVDAGVMGEEAIRVGKLLVRGDVVARANRGALQLVNVIPIEEYLVGVLGSEMPPGFPKEALKAQAVAARTYALFKKLAAYGEPFHLGSSVLGQVYGGFTDDPRVRTAVEETRGLVMTYELAPVEAYFHASCGGRTESGRDALGRELPYLESVECPCGELPMSLWHAALDADEIQKTFGRGRSLSVVARTSTGRARRVELAGRTLDAVTFRRRVGYSRVKSLSFEVERTGDTFKLTGRGYGHGAGLCQWGAKVYAERGWDFRRILAHYYPGAEIQLLN